jgi:hypothetical protein
MKYSFKSNMKETKFKKNINGRNKTLKNNNKYYNWIYKYFKRNMKFCNLTIRIEFMKIIIKQSQKLISNSNIQHLMNNLNKIII